jgi:co-chaperonin GroES (HSP10)
MDIDTISLVQRKVKKALARLKDNAIYSVDTMEKLQYVRGQIRSLEDLQQDLKDLLTTTEYEDDRVHGDTETDKSTLDKLPTPTGYRILVLPFAGPKKTKGGLWLSDTTQETIQMTTVCGLVLKMGDLCYHDKDKFPKGPWCKLNEWIIFSRYAGSRFKIDGGEVRVLNDDEVISTISDPNDILHHY